MVVYFVQAQYGAIKIGTTSADGLRSRLSTIQGSNPEPIRLLGTIPGGREREKQLHEELKRRGFNVRGEWFQANDAVIRLFVRLMKRRGSVLCEYPEQGRDFISLEYRCRECGEKVAELRWGRCMDCARCRHCADLLAPDEAGCCDDCLEDEIADLTGEWPEPGELLWAVPSTLL